MTEATRIELIGPEPSGLAQMMAAIAEGNLRDDPGRTVYLLGKPGVIQITATDAEVTVALEFRDGRLRVYSGERTSPPDVHIMADSESLTGMSETPQIGPLPNPFRKAGRMAWRKVFRGDVKIKGAARNGKLLKRMRKLMAVGGEAKRRKEKRRKEKRRSRRASRGA